MSIDDVESTNLLLNVVEENIDSRFSVEDFCRVSPLKSWQGYLDGAGCVIEADEGRG